MSGDNPAVIGQLFTPEVLARLAAINRPPAPREDHAAAPIRQRHLIFAQPNNTSDWIGRRRATWSSYIAHAHSAGLLDADVRQRLIDTDDDNFRGALSECMCSWFFANRLGLPLCPNHSNDGRRSDFEADGPLHVEVKAPYVPVPGSSFGGDDAKIIRDCVSTAGRQFKKNVTNVVVLAPLLRTPVWMDREQLVKAVIGEWAWSYEISLDPNLPTGEVEDVFLQKGKLAKLHPTTDGETRTDFTRVSAVATLEERTVDGDKGVELSHVVHVVHNPFATNPLARDLFSAHPQLLVLEAGKMAWTDKMPT